jgi:predicted negative regulator of RcsB-dependent stress response
VDENLSEKEQIEEIRHWFKENGLYLFGGVALVLVAYVGLNQYEAWRNRNAEAAAAVYVEIRQLVADDDREAADSRLAELAAQYANSAYLDQARLLIAEANVVRDPARSIAELNAVVERDGDDGIVQIARLRLARVLAYQERYDEALAALEIAEPGAFAASFAEVRGDIHVAMGDHDAAASAYTDALLGGGNGSVNIELVQLKLNDAFQAREPEASAAAESATAEPATEPSTTEPVTAAEPAPTETAPTETAPTESGTTE